MLVAIQLPAGCCVHVTCVLERVWEKLKIIIETRTAPHRNPLLVDEPIAKQRTNEFTRLGP